MSTQTPTTRSDGAAPAPILDAAVWQVDPARSRVHFHTRAMFGLFPVLGRFERFDGTLAIDQEGRASGNLRIHAASIRTGIGKRDRHLQSEDFFHAAEHPHATFELASLQPHEGGYEVSGTLRIRDKELPVRTQASVRREGEELVIGARFPVDHDAAGLGWAKPGMVRGTIDADVELTLQRAEAAA